MRESCSCRSLLLCLALGAAALPAAAFDAAAAFGARIGVEHLRISPDGSRVVFLAPTAGQGSVAYVQELARGARAHPALRADGKPFRLQACDWISNGRLLCQTTALTRDPTLHIAPLSRLVAVDADGSHLQVLSTRENFFSRGYQLYGGGVIDWLPGEDGAVLMTRVYLPDDHTGSRIGSAKEGLGVDRIDTRTLSVSSVAAPVRDAVEYISDGRGHVRIMGLRRSTAAGRIDTGVTAFMYRKAGETEWLKLSDFDAAHDSGFEPVAVDPASDLAYGFEKRDGRWAVGTVKLDGSLGKDIIASRPDVDIDRLETIGRGERVVAFSYATEYRHFEALDPGIKALLESLHRALPGKALTVVDASLDESRLVVLATADTDPGAYYIFDRKSHTLETFLVQRGELEGVELAPSKPVRYAARDGVEIPAYLTRPPGPEGSGPRAAIVMPHGGPASRDEWGFNWLAQFYATRGYVVLQPNYRGSEGYGDEWFRHGGFKSWEVAIADVIDAGRWLVAQRIAKPDQLFILGWSYGGYAALQAATVEPDLFKAVVAIAPVTDLALLKTQYAHWTSYELNSEFIGDGPHMHDGSPIEHVERIKAPVLLVHGTMDRNVDYEQSRTMAARLGARGRLMTFEGLDHALLDSSARAEILRGSDAWFAQAPAAHAPAILPSQAAP